MAEAAADGLQVAGDGVNGGQFALLGLGGAVGLGEVSLGEAVAFALFGDGGQRRCRELIRRAIPPVRPSLTKVA